jgi:hypothetical protein
VTSQAALPVKLRLPLRERSFMGIMACSTAKFPFASKITSAGVHLLNLADGSARFIVIQGEDVDRPEKVKRQTRTIIKDLAPAWKNAHGAL